MYRVFGQDVESIHTICRTYINKHINQSLSSSFSFFVKCIKWFGTPLTRKSTQPGEFYCRQVTAILLQKNKFWPNVGCFYIFYIC